MRDEPLVVSLIRYRPRADRQPATDGVDPNLVSSLVSGRGLRGRHKPVLDLDFPHTYLPSQRPGHGHLYLDVEIPWWRWALLMVSLRLAGVVEVGYTAWSLRRGANFVRPPGVQKTVLEHSRSEAVPKYGWIRRKRR